MKAGEKQAAERLIKGMDRRKTKGLCLENMTVHMKPPGGCLDPGCLEHSTARPAQKGSFNSISLLWFEILPQKVKKPTKHKYI